MSVLPQTRQSTPDLKQDFLKQVLLVVDVPRIDPADLENPGSIPVDQFQKLSFVWRFQSHEPLTD
jgi:hypothetical protein